MARHTWPGKRPHKKLLPTHLFWQGHWFFLCHALLALLLLYPYLETTAEEKLPWLLALMNSVVVVTLVYAVSFNVRQLALISLIGLLSLLTEWLPSEGSVEMVRLAARVLLYGYAILMVLPYVLAPAEEEEPNSDRIFAVVSTYLLIGLTWTALYEIVELFYPNSFFVPTEYNHDGALTWSDYLYFSFVTLTNTGYGNLAPITSQARSLAILEACTGTLFVAIMIARTIGLYLSRALR